MHGKIPVSVLITTLNEERNLARCLASLERFDEIIVIDSNSTDKTQDIARSFNVSVVPYTWNGAYPKKRQWCLDTLALKYDRVFFIDADEEATPALCDEIAALDWRAAGYFVKGYYILNGKVLYHGLHNSKLCLFDRRKIKFPVVDDLDIPGMGEIEGHYQPVLTGGAGRLTVLRNAVIHHAMLDPDIHEARHRRYAVWEKAMRERRAYPEDPVFIRRCLKKVFQHVPGRPVWAFLHSYIFKAGFFDRREGFLLAKARYNYYRYVK